MPIPYRTFSDDALNLLVASGDAQALMELGHRAKRQSLRAAVNAMCRQCIYDPNGSGTWRQQVEACTSPKCPLYPVRPMSRPSPSSETMERT